jgi:3-carboxy-cis,cis-muconate cycloisomerase
MTSRLIDGFATTDALAAVFSDESLLQAMLDVEVALARAEARVGVIPARAAESIRAAAAAGRFDAAAFAHEAREAGTVVIPLVNALSARVRDVDPESARFVHWGATSQDIIDSAMMLAVKRAAAIVAGDHQKLVRALHRLSDRHAATVMIGRTLLQPAVPITFGLKVAGWVAALARGWTRLDAALHDALVLQLGGAAGTLAALGDKGLAVAAALAEKLDLVNPGAPWHTHRDRLAAVVTSAGIYTGTLGKIARDIALLMQDEVGEVSEPGGGSSSMPHKRNPAGSAVVLAAATRMPGLVAAFLIGMVQEHERAVGGWQAEWPTIAAAVQCTGSAAAAMAGIAGSLDVRVDRMRENVERTKGAVFAERVVALAAARAGKESAQALVSQALARSRESGRTLREVLASMPEAAAMLSADELAGIDVPERYLGAAEALRIRLLNQAGF